MRKIHFIFCIIMLSFTHAQSQSMQMNDSMVMNNMPSLLPMNSMSRGGSGTSWLPDNAPMHMWMFNTGNWEWMVHGNITAAFTDQNIFHNDSLRGGSKFFAPGMIMFMGSHAMGKKWLLNIHTMFSPDPFTVNSGYPLLFQTGETYHGKPNIDIQHPHDLFGELGLSLGYQLSNNSGIYVYAGYPGEPALGPCAFPHRPSAMDLPDAPLSHHWQDASHVTFGVVTLGFQHNNFKVEGSLFNGSEPDENRYDFDKLQLNSFSGRVSWNPSNAWALQVSSGFLKHPEVLESTDQVRTTASAIYSKHKLEASLVIGVNHFSDNSTASSVLLEASRRFKALSFFGRYEFVQKNAEELGLGLSGYVNVNVISTGIAHYFKAGGLSFGIGGVLGTNPFLSNEVQAVYGNEPVSGEVFISVRPLFKAM